MPQRWSACRELPHRAQRAQIVLLAAQGLPDGEIARRLGISRPVVLTWRARYARGGLSALADRPRSGRPRQVNVGDVLASTLRTAPRLRSATSCARWVAAELGISPATVSRDWRSARVNVAGSGAVLYESEPPVALTDLQILAVCLHGTSGVAVLQPRLTGPAGRLWVHRRTRCAAQMSALLCAAQAGSPLTAVITGDTFRPWSRLSAVPGGMSWHVAPSVSSWLAMVEGVAHQARGSGRAAAAPAAVMTVGGAAAGRAPASAAHGLAAELRRLMTTPPGIRGWHLWIAV
jgi:DNA-binding CsgD family transcriptional regulator